MRCIIEYEKEKTPPLIRFYIHGAPHRRAHRAILERYRKELWEAANLAGITASIDRLIEISVLFINPTGPDLDNLITALFQALDGKTGSGPTVLTDDELICNVNMGRMTVP